MIAMHSSASFKENKKKKNPGMFPEARVNLA